MALEMNPEIRARWAAALRSGDYRQGTKVLRTRPYGPGPDEFCCMGVLCDLAVKDGVLHEPEYVECRTAYAYSTETEYLPEAVREWAGLREYNPLVVVPTRNGASERESLAVLNDEFEWDFRLIADAIDGGES